MGRGRLRNVQLFVAAALLGGAAVSGADRPSPSDPVAGREHWAFRPLAPGAPPAGGAGEDVRSPIDALVLARIRAAGLEPAGEADRRTLLRRLSFVLTGLPPEPSEIATFLADDRSDAYERLVDRLLASPRFGERWARHWLDLARYADSNGLDENFLFREAWRYRNWVIDAVNEDLPFDRFILEQIAGDLLPYNSVEERDRQRIAAGFLVVGPKVLLGNDPANQRMEVADEQVDTIGRAILGQTLGCARCHDHKFDPFPTADYYALAGIFTSTQVLEQRFMLGEQRVMERLVGLGERGAAADESYEVYWRGRPQLQARHRAAEALLTALETGGQEAVRAAALQAGAAVPEALDQELELEARAEAQRALVARLGAELASPPAIPPRAMIPADSDAPSDERIRLAGQFNRPGEVVARGFPRVLGDSPAKIPPGGSGRLELARWLTDVEHGAGALAARVLANRIWYHVMGRGIVRTVDNFGRTGEPPEPPELLEHLARSLIDSGWSVRGLVRSIVLTRAFRMRSTGDPRGEALDPENKLHWRAHRRRLDPEALRDGMLAAAGRLDLARVGSTVGYLGDQATAVGDNKNRRRTDFNCRSIFLPAIRNDLPELFQVFDFADPHCATGMRPETISASQGLLLLNADFVLVLAEATASRILREKEMAPGQENVPTTPRDLVRRLYELVVGKPALDAECGEMVAFTGSLETELAEARVADARLRAWSLASQALFASSRFQILE